MKSAFLAAVSAVALTGNFAIAADLPARTTAPPVPVPVFTWSGLYAGASLGGLMARSKVDELTYYGTAAGFPMTSANGTGVIASLNLGYNIQVGNIVTGVEADLGWTSARARGSEFVSGEYNFIRVDYSTLGSLRARLGYAFDRVLVYGTGGLAIANIKSVGDHQYLPGATTYDGIATHNGIRTGWIIGGGLEYAVTQNYSLKAEALYQDLGNVVSGVASSGCRFGFKKTTSTVVRAGVNYKF